MSSSCFHSAVYFRALSSSNNSQELQWTVNWLFLDSPPRSLRLHLGRAAQLLLQAIAHLRRMPALFPPAVPTTTSTTQRPTLTLHRPTITISLILRPQPRISFVLLRFRDSRAPPLRSPLSVPAARSFFSLLFSRAGYNNPVHSRSK